MQIKGNTCEGHQLVSACTKDPCHIDIFGVNEQHLSPFMYCAIINRESMRAR